jgi:hypothetical protein
MPQKKPQSPPAQSPNPRSRQQHGGAQPQGGATGQPRQQQQQPPGESDDPRGHDQDVQEKAPEGDVETGRGGRSPQVDIDRE